MAESLWLPLDAAVWRNPGMNAVRRSNVGFWAVLLAIFFGLPEILDRNLVRGDPPAVEGRFLDGKEFSWAEVRGQPVLLYFWGTWCPVCRTMQGSIQSLTEDHSVVTVALQSGTQEEIRAYLERHSLSWLVISDPTGSIAGRYGLRAVPALFFINGGGQIRFAATGYTTELGIRFRLWLMDKLA